MRWRFVAAARDDILGVFVCQIPEKVSGLGPSDVPRIWSKALMAARDEQ